ncbi:MAG: tetratricopeptide repeat protein, partial [Planctomycetota bacterium]
MTVSTPLSPADAAGLLRAARRDVDAVEWAFLALPASRAALRLRIEQLLAGGDTESAEALIARALLHHPSDPTLARLRAECHLRHGAIRLADREIRFALERRPHHVATLVLGGRIARAAGDAPLAIERLQAARAARPGRDDVARPLVVALLEAGWLTRAERVLRSMAVPCPALEARLLAEQGRVLEAIERLERVVDGPSEVGDAFDLDDATETLIELLERAGDADRLRARLDAIGPDLPRALLAAGRAWLALGEHRRAAIRVAPLRRPGPWRREGLGIVVVAAALMRRRDLSERALRRLQRTRDGADPHVMAELWR